MRRFDYSFIRTSGFQSEIADLMMRIGELRERTAERRRANPDVFSGLERSARFLSVRGSNAIEGIRTSDGRLESLMDRSVEPVGHDEREIAGYRDALAFIHENHSELQLNERTVLEIYRMMMSYSDGTDPGYKKTDNVIMEIDADGRRRVHFRPVPAAETPEAMEQLMLAYIDADSNGISDLFLIPCFILDFLSVHPFPDGNGRMSRLLTLLLYYKAGFDAGKYISFEERIDQSKDRYYDALTRSSEGWHDNSNDYSPFITYYTGILFQCYRGLDRCFATVAGKSATKGNRIEAVILNSLVPIGKRDIMSMLPDVSQTTVEACLHRMLENGTIEKIGSNRNARYIRRN